MARQRIFWLFVQFFLNFMDYADNAGKIEGRPCLFWQGDALFEGEVSNGTGGRAGQDSGRTEQSKGEYRALERAGSRKWE